MLVESKIIAVDFDGTIVANKYPKIGKPLPFAFETLKMLQAKGHRLILWTVRTGSLLREAVDFCEKHGVEFYAVNEDYPGEGDKIKNRKLNADLFIDDRNVGGMLQWGEIYQWITGEQQEAKPKKKWGIF
jgi:hydroxymethylpyrimidine pyrophosphatase-like HAD family hydrolase